MADVASPAVQKALQILRLLAREEHGLTLSEIAETLALPKSSVHGLLQTLEVERFVEKNLADNRFRIGLSAFEVGSAYVDRSEVVHQFSTHAHALAAAFDQVVFLAIEDREHVVTIAKEEGNGPVRCVVPLGGRSPIWSSAAGKVFLASCSETRLQLTFQSIRTSAPNLLGGTTFAQFQRDLLTVRVKGYAVAEDVLGPGTRSIAAPVRDFSRNVVAALGVVMPTTSFDTDVPEALVEAVTQAALDLSLRLGYRPDGADYQATRHEAGAVIGGPAPLRLPNS